MNGYKILVVEDERITADDIQKTLKRLGHSVSGIASSGEEAIQKATATHPDLVLMDIKLKGAMNGFEVANHLYDELRVPVIYLTAHSDDEMLKRAKFTEPFGYIVKPFEERSLRASIEMAVYKSQMEIERENLLAKIEETDAKLKRASKELLRSNEALEQFTAVASHDLKSPLCNIIAYSEDLEIECPELGTEGKKDIKVIRQCALRMNKLIDDLLQFAKISHAPRLLKEIDLKSLLSKILGDLEAKIKEKKATVKIGTLPRLKADPLQMQHVFQNLIENALKYSCNGKTPTIDIDGKVVNHFVEIHVRDNGIGFDKKSAEEVFLPFKQLHNKNKYDGTGIGLAICQKIIETHGGKITAKSKLNEGSDFIIKLPAID